MPKKTKDKMPDQMSFRWRIAKAGYTESAVAKEIGICNATMSRIVRGLGKSLPLTLVKIETWLQNKGV